MSTGPSKGAVSVEGSLMTPKQTMRSCVWYRARLSPDQIAAGYVEIIRRRFSQAVEAAGAPEGACLFVTSHEARPGRLREDVADHEAVDADTLFFSPLSISLIPELLSACAAEPSEPPDRTRAALMVGHARDWELLPHSSH